jgi:capsular exopolysaccharide synthesis family protein
MIRNSQSRTEGTPGLRDLLAVLARRKTLILLVALPIIAASVLYSYSRTPVYSSSAGILVTPALTSLTSAARPPELDAQTETSLATSVAVATLAQKLIGSSITPQNLLKRVSANMVNGTQFLTISFTDADAVTAQQGAAAFSEAYLQYRQQHAQDVIQQQADTIDRQVDNVRSRLQEVSNRLRELPRDTPARLGLQSERDVLSGRQLFLQNQLVTLLSITTHPGEVVDPASVPGSPATPRHAFDIAIGILLGLGLGFAAALIQERSSDAVRSPLELEEKCGIPVLGSIPRSRDLSGERTLVVAERQRTITADAFRRLRTRVLATATPSHKTILITSAVGGEGKTVTVANLAAALAEIGRRVILLSADLRSPGLQRIFAANDLAGLSQGLTDDASAWELVYQTGMPNLRFVPNGAQSNQIEPVNLLQSDRMRELLETWGRDADFILVDSPPVLGVPDALVLARMVDGVLFVVDAEASRWDDVVLARDELERAGGVLLAGVLNRVSVSRRDRRAWKARGVPARRRDTERHSRSTKHPPQAVHQEL